MKWCLKVQKRKRMVLKGEKIPFRKHWSGNLCWNNGDYGTSYSTGLLRRLFPHWSNLQPWHISIRKFCQIGLNFTPHQKSKDPIYFTFKNFSLWPVNPQTTVAQKVAAEVVFRHFQGGGVEFFLSDLTDPPPPQIFDAHILENFVQKIFFLIFFRFAHIFTLWFTLTRYEL